MSEDKPNESAGDQENPDEELQADDLLEVLDKLTDKTALLTHAVEKQTAQIEKLISHQNSAKLPDASQESKPPKPPESKAESKPEPKAESKEESESKPPEQKAESKPEPKAEIKPPRQPAANKRRRVFRWSSHK